MRQRRERRPVCEGWPVWQRNADTGLLCLSPLNRASEFLSPFSPFFNESQSIAVFDCRPWLPLIPCALSSWLSSVSLISVPLNYTALNVRSRCEDIFMWSVNIFIRRWICGKYAQASFRQHINLLASMHCGASNKQQAKSFWKVSKTKTFERGHFWSNFVQTFFIHMMPNYQNFA